MPAHPIDPLRRHQLLGSRAAAMRAQPTLSEAVLWAQIRGGRLGLAVRRQVVLGDFIVDFLVPKARLVIEVDGGYHRTRLAADARRDRKLRALGYRVLRLDAELVMRALPEAVERVREALAG